MDGSRADAAGWSVRSTVVEQEDKRVLSLINVVGGMRIMFIHCCIPGCPALHSGIVRLARRELVWINVTAHPTAEWITQQLTEAFPWNEAPRYLIRDRDGIYGCCGHAPITSRVSGATRRRYEACTPIGTHHALASRYEAPACGVGPRSPSYSPSPPRRRRGRGDERSAASDSGLAMEAT